MKVDFWIIPQKVKNALSQNVDEEDEEDSDEDEDDEDSDDEDEETMSEDLVTPLKKFGAKYLCGTIDHEKEAQCVRTLHDTFTKLLQKNAKRSVKVCHV